MRVRVNENGHSKIRVRVIVPSVLLCCLRWNFETSRTVKLFRTLHTIFFFNYFSLRAIICGGRVYVELTRTRRRRVFGALTETLTEIRLLKRILFECVFDEYDEFFFTSRRRTNELNEKLLTSIAHIRYKKKKNLPALLPRRLLRPATILNFSKKKKK